MLGWLSTHGVFVPRLRAERGFEVANPGLGNRAVVRSIPFPHDGFSIGSGSTLTQHLKILG
jgi:hypothetical protein